MWNKLLRWATYGIPLLFFALLMNAGPVLKRPLGQEDRLMAQLETTEQAVLAGDWAAAATAWEQVDRASALVVRRIQLMAERDEVQAFYQELARLRGSIQAQEAGAALGQISVLKGLYDELGQ